MASFSLSTQVIINVYIALAGVSGSMETPMDGETLENSISNMMHFVPRSKTTRRQKQCNIEEMAQEDMHPFRQLGF